MKRILALVGGLMCLALVMPGCRHTEINERPVVTQQPPPQKTVIEHEHRSPDVIIEHH